MKKQNLGALVILAGIGFIGFIWFKRNKPTTADKQLADLTNLSTALKVNSTGDLDKPFEYTEEQKSSAGRNPFTNSTIDAKDMYSNLTPAEVKALADAVNQACPSCAGLANIGAINMDNVDFSNLGNIGFTNIKV